MAPTHRWPQLFNLGFNRYIVTVFQDNRHRHQQQSPRPLPVLKLFAYSSYTARYCEARGIIEQGEIQTESAQKGTERKRRNEQV
jgi:hypothetical protein